MGKITSGVISSAVIGNMFFFDEEDLEKYSPRWILKTIKDGTWEEERKKVDEVATSSTCTEEKRQQAEERLRLFDRVKAEKERKDAEFIIL